MYSRSRQLSGEERYQSNIPPLYNGNHFRYVRQEETEGVRASMEHTEPHRETAQPDHPAEERQSEERQSEEQQSEEQKEEHAPECGAECAVECAEQETARTGGLPELISGIGQEELLLIALLLLMCAEHDHSMDIIVILLLLIGIQ